MLVGWASAGVRSSTTGSSSAHHERHIGGSDWLRLGVDQVIANLYLA